MFHKFEFRPAITPDTKKVLDLKVMIYFVDQGLLRYALAEALRKNPGKAISVTILKESDGYWQNVSDNRHLVNSVEKQSGSTYKMRYFGRRLWYDVFIKSLSAGSTYLIVADIAEHLRKNHVYIAKVRLVCFLPQHFEGT